MPRLLISNVRLTIALLSICQRTRRVVGISPAARFPVWLMQICPRFQFLGAYCAQNSAAEPLPPQQAPRGRKICFARQTTRGDRLVQRRKRKTICGTLIMGVVQVARRLRPKKSGRADRLAQRRKRKSRKSPALAPNCHRRPSLHHQDHRLHLRGLPWQKNARRTVKT